MYEFPKIPIVVDPRVTPVLARCLVCHQPLREIVTAHQNTMMLAAQCPRCPRVYILDEMTVQ